MEKLKKNAPILLAVMAGFVFVYFASSPNDLKKTETEAKQEILSINDRDHVYGSRDADVVIIEYAEVECIYCKQLHPILRRVTDENSGKVAVVYRHFPLPIHPKSFVEAMALECVAELGGNGLFWEFLTDLFEATPSNNNIDLAILPSLAKKIGIDGEIFNECLDSERHRERIQYDIETGFSLNVDSVPQLFVVAPNGQVFPFTKTPTYTTLKATIEAALSLSK